VADQPPNRRTLQAAQTRLDILGAARRLFAERGYVGTSVKDIAKTAGVSLQTVYDSVGSKAGVVGQLNDGIDAEARVFEIVGQLATITDPGEIVRLPARVTGRLVERCGDIMRAVLGGAHSEPELAIIALEGQRRHRDGAARIAQRLDELGAIVPGTVDQTALTLGALADYRLTIGLVDEYGLTVAQAVTWVGDTSAGATLPRTP
jgi:AcrR family transcriptional regulator